MATASIWQIGQLRRYENCEKAKSPRNRKTIDGTAGSVRRLTVGRERKHTKNRKGETGHGYLPFGKAGVGVFIRRDRIYRDNIHYAERGSSGGKVDRK